jgi:hypothetical protein
MPMPMRKVGVVLHLLALLSGGLWTSVVVAQVAGTSNSSSNGTNINTSMTTVTVGGNTTTTSTSNITSSNTTRPACYTSFREIIVDMETKDPFSFATYIVCPNTIIEIGTMDEFDMTVFINGGPPLTLRQFSRVYCGEDGASSNNCTVRGGASQVDVSSFMFSSEVKKRMEVKGFTFEAAKSFAVFAFFAEGDLLFEDCIFRNISQGGVLTAFVVAQQPPPDITFRNCRFDNNMGVNDGNMFEANEGVRLTITDSVFSNNKYKSDRVVRFCKVSSFRIVFSPPIFSNNILHSMHTQTNKLTSTHIVTTYRTTTHITNTTNHPISNNNERMTKNTNSVPRPPFRSQTSSLNSRCKTIASLTTTLKILVSSALRYPPTWLM